MKRTIIGCCLTIVGAFSCIASMIFSGSHLSNVTGWSTPPGKFWTAVGEVGMNFPIIFSSFLFVIGLFILGLEYFKKD